MDLDEEGNNVFLDRFGQRAARGIAEYAADYAIDALDVAARAHPIGMARSAYDYFMGNPQKSFHDHAIGRSIKSFARGIADTGYERGFHRVGPPGAIHSVSIEPSGRITSVDTPLIGPSVSERASY